MIEAVVDSIRVNLVSQTRIVFLKELHGARHLPIFIGESEANAIAMEIQGMVSPRPQPWDLLKTIIGDLNSSVDRVVVSELSHDIFFARIVLSANGRVLEVDSRASDAIALAVRVKCPIMVEDAVMDSAGVEVDVDDDEDDDSGGDGTAIAASSGGDDERLSVFRDFIDTLDLDDFERRRGN